jgi:hypothetical protein
MSPNVSQIHTDRMMAKNINVTQRKRGDFYKKTKNIYIYIERERERGLGPGRLSQLWVSLVLDSSFTPRRAKHPICEKRENWIYSW